ncbi:hypothetical protein [Curtobacterium pusillum]|uniref:hypothetical protein n=1 Tax=Curtobacterium pusillum TaxID=69373 RepID=UPI001643DC30|nr:hypothetical protein [Curtobacterium pusillum]
MSSDVPSDYQKDFDYLRDLGRRGTLRADNPVYRKLDDKARNLPGLKRALNTLSVRY